jgi:hypothetical protein
MYAACRPAAVWILSTLCPPVACTGLSFPRPPPAVSLEYSGKVCHAKYCGCCNERANVPSYTPFLVYSSALCILFPPTSGTVIACAHMCGLRCSAGRLMRRRAWLDQVGVSICDSRGPEAAFDRSQEQDVEDFEGYDCDDEAHQVGCVGAADAGESCFPTVTALAATPEELPVFPLWCMTWTPSLLHTANRSFSTIFALPVTFLLDVTACIALVSAITADHELLRLSPSSFSIEFNRWQHSDERRVVVEGGGRCVAPANISHAHLVRVIITSVLICSRAARSTRSLIMQLLEKGDRVLVGSAAWQVFNSIVDTIGGPGERLRRDGFLSQMRCKVIPNVPCSALEDVQSKLGKKKDTNTVITVATAVATKSVLVTSNMGFLNAAWQTARFHVPAVFHPARALFKA